MVREVWLEKISIFPDWYRIFLDISCDNYGRPWSTPTPAIENLREIAYDFAMIFQIQPDAAAGMQQRK